MSKATERFPQPGEETGGAGHVYEQAVKGWILRNNPGRSRIVSDAEIAAAIRAHQAKGPSK
jgi:hypothetical protein